MLSTELTDAIELMFETGWTDGLPVVPPSEDLVRRFVARTGRDADELIAELPPLGGRATVERIAVNAVMAGCVPEHMPVVITALQAMMDERFNLRGVMCSTGIHTPLLIVNGPAVQKLDINGGYNCFGAGWRANATIGRAVKLALVNLGGAIPGETNKATFGHPGAYTYCVAEDESANPWMPMHVEMGFAATDSTVTVFPAEAPHNIMYHASNSRDFLTVLADTMCPWATCRCTSWATPSSPSARNTPSSSTPTAGTSGTSGSSSSSTPASRCGCSSTAARPRATPAAATSGPVLSTRMTTTRWCRWCAPRPHPHLRSRRRRRPPLGLPARLGIPRRNPEN